MENDSLTNTRDLEPYPEFERLFTELFGDEVLEDKSERSEKIQLASDAVETYQEPPSVCGSRSKGNQKTPGFEGHAFRADEDWISDILAAPEAPDDQVTVSSAPIEEEVFAEALEDTSDLTGADPTVQQPALFAEQGEVADPTVKRTALQDTARVGNAAVGEVKTAIVSPQMHPAPAQMPERAKSTSLVARRIQEIARHSPASKMTAADRASTADRSSRECAGFGLVQTRPVRDDSRQLIRIQKAPGSWWKRLWSWFLGRGAQGDRPVLEQPLSHEDVLKELQKGSRFYRV